MNKALTALFACLLLVGVSASAADDDPFLIDKRQFKKQFKTIALAPVDADGALQMPDSVAQVIEQEVTRHLQKRGYTVIPTSVLAEIRKTMEQQVGGFTDPETGQVDMAKMQAVRTHAFRELWFQHNFDALATIRVAVTRAPFENDRAEWDGVRQKVQAEGRNRGYSGNIAASSVSFAVYDHTEKLMYVNYGGLEVLQHREEAQLLPIPAENYFADEKLVRKATQIAMKPI
ncbi:MAG: hypothetical protein R3192_16830 [Woeseiaceae bacterium]|nr:hypothetical protein [Woeseiaceae bacterium]